jgi:hypothetical protein
MPEIPFSSMSQRLLQSSAISTDLNNLKYANHLNQDGGSKYQLAHLVSQPPKTLRDREMMSMRYKPLQLVERNEDADLSCLERLCGCNDSIEDRNNSTGLMMFASNVGSDQGTCHSRRPSKDFSKYQRQFRPRDPSLKSLSSNRSNKSNMSKRSLGYYLRAEVNEPMKKKQMGVPKREEKASRNLEWNTVFETFNQN